MDEHRLTRVLGAYREQMRAQPAHVDAWLRIEERAGRRVPMGLVAIATVTALAIAAAAILIPARRERAIGDKLTSAPGELVYMSLHFDANVLGSIRTIAMDMRTGRKRTLAIGGICGDAGAPTDPDRNRVAFCGPDEKGVYTIWILDLSTGRKARVRPQSGYSPMGWTPGGDLLLLRQQPKPHAVFAVNGDASRLVFTSERFEMAAAGMSDGVTAVMQSLNSASECDAGGCRGNELVLVRQGRVVMTVPDYAAPLVPFDGGDSLLIVSGSKENGRIGSLQLQVIHRTDGRFELRRTGIKEVFGSPAVGPDGRIAITNGKSIFVLAPVSLTLRRVTAGHGPIAWTPDGKAIVYAGPDAGNRNTTIRITDLEGHSRVLVSGEDVRVAAVAPG